MKKVRVYYLEKDADLIDAKEFDTHIGSKLWLELRGDNLQWAAIEFIWHEYLRTGLWVEVNLHGR